MSHMLKIGLPNNFFGKLFFFSFPETLRKSVNFYETYLLANLLDKKELDVALIQSLDYGKRENLYISKKAALSFDAEVSLSYFYFQENLYTAKQATLYGEVGTNDAILTKILFAEKYNLNIDLELFSGSEFPKNREIVLVRGDANYQNDLFMNGLSFADEISDLLMLPYVDYVFASYDKENLLYINKTINSIEEVMEKNLSKYLDKFENYESFKVFFKERFNQVYFELTDNEVEGLKELIKLPFYFGLFEEIFEIKLVE